MIENADQLQTNFTWTCKHPLLYFLPMVIEIFKNAAILVSHAMSHVLARHAPYNFACDVDSLYPIVVPDRFRDVSVSDKGEWLQPDYGQHPARGVIRPREAGELLRAYP